MNRQMINYLLLGVSVAAILGVVLFRVFAALFLTSHRP